jgi:YVTN family beta-propeller protein
MWNNRGTKELTIIDANGLEVLKTLPLPATSFQLALSPDGKTLAVAYKDTLKVSLIDTVTDEIVKTIPVGKEPWKWCREYPSGNQPCISG